MILRCTQKFLSELRLTKSDIDSQLEPMHPLDDWYAHVFYIYPHRKCTVFVHATTMFSFFALDVKRDDLNSIGKIFYNRLGKALLDERYPKEVIKLFNKQTSVIRITSTKDHVVIGTINHLIQDLQMMMDHNSLNDYDEAQLGAYFRRGVYLAFPGEPMRMMREVLRNCEELKGLEIPAFI